MKRKLIFTLTIFVLLSFGLTGCTDDEDSGPPPASLAFVDDGISPTKEFTIYENLTFKVTFVKDDEGVFASMLKKGTTVSGKINTTNKWKDDEITGTAVNMKSSNNDLTGILGTIDSMKLELKYTKSSNGEIGAITVSFPGDGPLDVEAHSMMGGTYELKQ